MVDKKSLSAKKRFFEWLMKRLDEIQKEPLVQKYNEYKDMSSAQKMFIRQIWDEYYEKAYRSESSERFHLCKAALDRKDYTEVKRLAQEATEALAAQNYMKKPDEIDPYEMDFNPTLIHYRWLLMKIGDMKRDPDFGDASEESIFS